MGPAKSAPLAEASTEAGSAPCERYADPSSVFAALEVQVSGYHPVRLVRMSWLLQLQELQGSVLKRRQDLPDEAFISAEDLCEVWEASRCGGSTRRSAAEALPVVAVSCCWDSPEHPDPTGLQLRLVAEALRGQAEKYRACHDRACQGLGEEFGGFAEVGVFWDWASLLQGDPARADAARRLAIGEGKTEEEAERAAKIARRTPDEQTAFDHALHKTMDLWFAHSGITVLLCTQHPRERGSQRASGYEESGWAAYERCCAALKQARPWAMQWDDVVDIGSGVARAAGRRWPVDPDDFDELLASAYFAEEGDREAVRALFRRMCQDKLGSTEKLYFFDLPQPTTTDMARLGRCLLLCSSLKELRIAKAGIGDDEMEALAEVLEDADEEEPPLPMLSELLLLSNNIGDRGAEALAGALHAAPRLEELHLQRNLLGEEGIAALVEAWEPRCKAGLMVGDAQRECAEP